MKAEDFWDNVEIRGDTDCWPWLGSKDRGGYGRAYLYGKTRGAHRVAYSLRHGAPPDLWVLHKCDVPACCNPHHLTTGNAQDNTRDMIERRRNHVMPGEANPSAKLTTPAVRHIRRSNQSARALTHLYGVSHAQISKIRSRQAWKHVH